MVGENIEVEAMDRMIAQLPESLFYNKEFTFYLSAQFAQSLLNYVNNFYRTNKIVMQKGDEFTWKGFNCKVL